jgi:hypothetical protein
MRYACRPDTNHAEIRQGLKDAHYVVEDTSAYRRGFPDLMVDVAGTFVLFEIKMPGEKLTDREIKLHAKFAMCPIYVVYSLEDALRRIGEVMRR